jgi:carboxymethylenebutenolidase
VRAKGTTKRPAVIVIHENRGLNPHIEDVARRLAVEGYLALAPDLLLGQRRHAARGGQARELHTKTEREDMIAAAWRPSVPQQARGIDRQGRRGRLLLRRRRGQPHGDRQRRSRARRAYYGAQPPADMVPAIKAPLLLQYAENDENINKGIAAYEAALTPTTRSTPSTSIPARSTPSTTTPAPRATTRPRLTSPGAARSRSSRRTSAPRPKIG